MKKVIVENLPDWSYKQCLIWGCGARAKIVIKRGKGRKRIFLCEICVDEFKEYLEGFYGDLETTSDKREV